MKKTEQRMVILGQGERLHLLRHIVNEVSGSTTSKIVTIGTTDKSDGTVTFTYAINNVGLQLVIRRFREFLEENNVWLPIGGYNYLKGDEEQSSTIEKLIFTSLIKEAMRLVPNQATINNAIKKITKTVKEVL